MLQSIDELGLVHLRPAVDVPIPGQVVKLVFGHRVVLAHRYLLQHLVLTGPMAAGKTTLGRLLATHLDRPFLDSDAQIEKVFGMNSRELALREGVPALHAAEARVLVEALADRRPAVIAGAASVADSSLAVTAVSQSSAMIVLVESPTSVLVDRLRDAADHRRPISIEDFASQTAARRDVLLELDPLVIDTSLQGPSETAAEVLRGLA